MAVDKIGLLVALKSVRDDVERLTKYIDAKVLMTDLGELKDVEAAKTAVETLEDLAGALSRAEGRLDEDIVEVERFVPGATERTPEESGLCCMAKHAAATPPWTCDCYCHQRKEPAL
jgi:hypothetical protein